MDGFLTSCDAALSALMESWLAALFRAGLVPARRGSSEKLGKQWQAKEEETAGWRCGQTSKSKGWHVTAANGSRAHACLPVHSQGCRSRLSNRASCFFKLFPATAAFFYYRAMWKEKWLQLGFPAAWHIVLQILSARLVVIVTWTLPDARLSGWEKGRFGDTVMCSDFSSFLHTLHRMRPALPQPCASCFWKTRGL